MTNFDQLPLSEIKFDCRYFSGYKPCGKSLGCPNCSHYAPRGVEILIIKLGAMGDVLRTKSLLPGLKKAYPQSTITWLTNPGSAEVVHDSLVDRVLEFGAEAVLEVEAKDFDLLLCLDKEPHALALSGKLKANTKQGFAPTKHGNATIWNDGSLYAFRLGLSNELKYKQNRNTHPEILYQIAELPYEGQEYELSLSPESVGAVNEKLRQTIILQNTPIVGINTGCGEAFLTKAWTRNGILDSIHQLIETTGAVVFLLGGPREAELNESLRQELAPLYPERFLCTGTNNSLADFFAWVSFCDVVLSSDSLAMHVAIALKKRVVAFFGPTCEQEIALFGRGEKWVTDYACSPCYLKTCTVNPSCMQALTAEPIVSAIARQLDQLSPKASR